MSDPFPDIHRMIIFRIWIRIDLFVCSSTVAFGVHDFSISIFFDGLFAYNKGRMAAFFIIPKMRVWRRNVNV